MKVVVVGAYGLIGASVVARLLADGCTVTAVGPDVEAARRRMPKAEWVPLRLGAARHADWRPVLCDARAVVNCAGALQDSGRDDLDAVHRSGLQLLLEACEEAGVGCFVHISAAGVQAGRATRFNATKLAGEELVAAAPLSAFVLRPGLVLAPVAYGGTALLRALAVFPGLLPVAYPDGVVQVVSVEDVTKAVLRAVRGQAAPGRYDLLHGERHTLADLLAALRGWLGAPPARMARAPDLVAHTISGLADAAGRLGWRSPLRTTALAQLRSGVSGEAAEAERLLGRPPASLEAMLRDWPSGVQERWFARLYLLKPALILTLAGFWIASGLIGLTAGRAQAEAVLTQVGAAGALAATAVAGGSLLDLLLGSLVCHRRTARAALLGMLATSAAYMALGTWLRPDLWADPMGSFVKTVPSAMLALVTLAILEER
jgi:uncharacterized protein YbjT (DUF2867 family)